MQRHTNGSEVTFSASQQLVSTTDCQGNITYANSAFCEVAGFTLEELIGQPHNIVRHPDMPKAAFKDMWQHLKNDHSWRGMVKNRCKNGDYYWVDAFVTPLYENSEIVGYQSVRSLPSREHVNKAKQLYDQINSGAKLFALSESTMLKRAFAGGALILTAIPFVLTEQFALLLWLGIFATLMVAVFYQELIALPRALKVQSERLDSPSRYIFSGKGVMAQLDYLTQLHQAKMTTVLGRGRDSGKNLAAISTNLQQLATESLSGLESEGDHLSQLATAITQMSSTIDEVSFAAQNSHDKVVSVKQECNVAINTVSTGSVEMNQLAINIGDAAGSVVELVNEAGADLTNHVRNSGHCRPNQSIGIECGH